MHVFPANPNAVYISMVPNGCCQSAFDTTYPAQLNGIIQSEEYQQSITNINKSLKSRKIMLVFLAIFIVFVLAGIGLMLGGILTASKSRTTSFPVLVGVGIGLFALGMIILIVGSCVLQMRQMKRLRAAVAAESVKYSSRSPTPCSWRLDITATARGYGRNRRAVTIYHLIIDIGRQMGAFGAQSTYQYNPYPQPYPAPPQYGASAPPAYSAQPRPGFCTSCGTPRVNPTMKFCASCGQAFQ